MSSPNYLFNISILWENKLPLKQETVVLKVNNISIFSSNKCLGEHETISLLINMVRFVKPTQSDSLFAAIQLVLCFDQFSFDEALWGGWVRLTMTVCPDIQSACCLTNMCCQRSGVPSVSKQASTDPTEKGTVNVKSR